MNDFPPSDTTHLDDDERKEFLDRMLGESNVLTLVRRYTMMRPRVEIPRMLIGAKVVKNAPDKKPPADQKLQATPTFESLTLTSSRVVLPWTVTNEFLEDNPKGGRAEALIKMMMATQASCDMEDLAFNGDEESADALYRANDGWLKQAPKARVLTLRKRDLTEKDLAKALRSIPVKYRRRPEALCVFADPDVYMDLLTARTADARLDAGLTGPTIDGAEVEMARFLQRNVALITNPDNLIFGIERDMKMRVATGEKEKHYALHMRVDFVIQNREACVHVYIESVGDVVKRFFKKFRRKT